MMQSPRVLYWFRTDLRLHDSPAMKAALDLKPECLYPIWCWDPHYVYHARVGPNRWQFLIDCQNDLSRSITKINPKSKLYVLREAPVTLLPKLFKSWKISHLVFEKDTDAYGRERDDQVREIAKAAGVEVISRVGRTLWDPDELVRINKGPTMTIASVQNAAKKLGGPPRPIAPPTSLPDPGKTEIDFDHEPPVARPDLNARFRTAEDKGYHKLAGPDGDFSPPTMEQLSLKPATTQHRGGETEARKLLKVCSDDKKFTATFEKPKTAPTAFEPQSTTLLSPHMHFGSISCREFYWMAEDISKSYKGASQPPTSLTGQLMFRDMYFGAQASLGYTMGQTVGNPKCRFIPWHLPSVVASSPEKTPKATKIDESIPLVTGSYVIDSQEAHQWFIRWREGRTGFPWIDAVMRQLKFEGWIHHLARHAVACFLTRGGCYIDWARGAEVFEEWLLDHEPACNIGNWQWLSCSAFYSMYYRMYSPIAFPQKTDKEGAFVRRYCPELRDFPAKYIYEPWKAPIKDQKSAGCLIRGDGTEKEADGCRVYPKPMLDFNERRDICMKAMKTSYAVGLYGNDKRVLDGTWKALFDDAAEGPTRGKGPEFLEHEGETRLEDLDWADGSGEEKKAIREQAPDQGPLPKAGEKGAKRKRSVTQGTLDSSVKRTRGKMSSQAPN